MATQHDLADSFQLRSTDGWQTLLMILQSAGERLPKRPRTAMEVDDDAAAAVDASPNRHAHPTAASSASSSNRRLEPGERLAKRFAAVRLNDDRPNFRREAP